MSNLISLISLLDAVTRVRLPRRLEQETGIHLSLHYVDELIAQGKWTELEAYLTGFTRLKDNRYSLKAFFEIRKQKFLEALDKCDRPRVTRFLWWEGTALNRLANRHRVELALLCAGATVMQPLTSSPAS